MRSLGRSLSRVPEREMKLQNETVKSMAAMKGSGASMSTPKMREVERVSEMVGTHRRERKQVSCWYQPVSKVCWRSRRDLRPQRNSRTLPDVATHPVSHRRVLRVPLIVGWGQMALGTMVCGIARPEGVFLDDEGNMPWRALGR